MSDTKRYRVCEPCRKNRAFPDYDIPCPDCGHGDCAPGVVDAGVVWSREWPPEGARCVAYNPDVCDQPEPAFIISRDEIVGVGWCSKQKDGWQFAPLTIPAPPKE